MLRSAKEFDRVLRAGRRVAGETLTVAGLARADQGATRIGWVVPGKLGGAVVRNRIRRRLRAAAAALGNRVPGGLDCVVMAGRGTDRAEFQMLVDELGNLLDRLFEGAR